MPSRYQAIPGTDLGSFLTRFIHEPDETEIELVGAPMHRRSDGVVLPHVVTLGHLREEFAMRVTFPVVAPYGASA